jgi:hypothetical protein
MGINQKEAIEDALEEELESRPDLEPSGSVSRRAMLREGSGERSTTTRCDDHQHWVWKDADGALTCFGPLNVGRERRLNVLLPGQSGTRSDHEPSFN